jgi:hypothetical protein
MSQRPAAPELFELDLLGGVPTRRYRSLRPQAATMPWGTLELDALTAEELIQARRGWTDLALQEYASAGSQANVLRLLVRARVPLDLSAMLTPFPLDELLHTELCAGMAAELGGTTPVMYSPDEVFPPPADHQAGPLLAASRAVVWEFCVGETLSYGLLAAHARRAAQPLLRAIWQRLARDEAGHASFGWRFLDWVLPELDADERRDLAATAARALRHAAGLEDKIMSLPPSAFSALGTCGPDRPAYLALGRALLEERVRARLRERDLA